MSSHRPTRTEVTAALHPHKTPFEAARPPARRRPRSTPLLVTVLLVLAFPPLHAADPVPSGALTPSDADIIKMRGGPLAGMFATCGTPDLVIAKRGETKESDRVVFNYKTFLVTVRVNKVVACFFIETWKGPIRGVKIGDTRETVQKVLGAPKDTYKDKDGNITAYFYPMTDPPMSFYTNFDPATGLVRRVEVNEPEK